MKKPRRNGFTLIEMLTVIVIIVVVMTIGIPAFNNLMKSGGLSGASREVANALGLARQYAITHRTTTRVVFPDSDTTGTTGTNLAPWYQSYAVLDVGSGAYISKWEHLPLGTVFMDKNNPSLAGPAPLGLGDLQSASFPFPYTNSPPPLVTLAYIEFNPTGAATPLPPAGGPSTFTITEGFMTGGTIVVPTSKTSINTLANQSVITVDTIIGHIKVTRP